MAEKQQHLTKKRFEALLRKAAQPVSEWAHGQAETEKSDNHPFGGYSGKHKRQGKTEGAKD